MNPEDRRKIMARCYMSATQRLRTAFNDEFHGLLQEEYEMAGVDIRQRLTPKMKLEKDIAAARALLAEHGIDS
jgi:hypothetical protein